MQRCIANKSHTHRKVQTWCMDPSLNIMRLQPQMFWQLVTKITFSLLIPTDISSSLQQMKCSMDIGPLTRLIEEALLDEPDERVHGLHGTCRKPSVAHSPSP